MSLLKCTKCFKEKSYEEFENRNKGLKKKYSWCKDCAKIGKKISRAKAVLKLKIENPEQYKKQRRITTLKAYGLTIEHYELLLKEQMGRCAICFSDKSFGVSEHFHVDHDHVSGKVRGLLCSNCNTSLGLLKENKNIIKNILYYLEKHNGN